ncbi:HlyD family secretion protein [Dyella sp.]|jgi:membrane fusion protein, multidrug efflux system|uniref:HlyD family secretion protein n=1 Tax=Dyella sp. TaxID=1869338 RepID=UPI002B608E1C|nr:HlyD family secretion protein [Dyella sp.]HTC28620.1 HlyD family secretion protein [Dyella sp.]
MPAPTGSTSADASKDAAVQSGRRSNAGRFLLPVGLVLLVAAVLALAYWWVVGRFMQSTDDAYLQADSVTVAPKVSGYITDVYVGDNVTVKPGDPLVRLDSRQYQAALDQAQATVDAREADIQRAQAGIQQQRAAIEQAKAQLLVAQVASRHAEDEVRRYAPLASTGAESGDQLSVLTSNRDQARATLAADTAAVDQAQARITDLTAQIAQARAQLEAARASARQSQLDLQDTLVRSTLAGRVGDRTVRVGQYAQPGTRMMTIVPVQSVYLTANFKETQIGRMRAGQHASIHVDALPDTDLHGVVDSFSPGTGSEFALLPPENATGNFTKIVQRVPVRIRLDADEQTRKLLVPGLSVTVDVDTRTSTDNAQPTTADAHHG